MSQRAAKRRRRAEREAVRTSLLHFATKIRTVYAARLKEQRERFPNMRTPCDTCAIRTPTDKWTGFDKTWLHFLGALATDSAFYCHENLPHDPVEGWKPALTEDGQPDPDKMPPCAAWLVLAANPPFKLDEIGIDEEASERLAELILNMQADAMKCETPSWA